MRLLLVITLILSHALAFLPFWHRLRHNKIPHTADFAVISAILFYDLGIVLESLGFPYQSQYFTPFFDAQESTLLQATLLLIVTPWLFHVGSAMINWGIPAMPQQPVTGICATRRWGFYLSVILVSILLAMSGYDHLTSGAPLWAIRAQIGVEWGALIILLYLPLHFLSFYVRQQDSRTLFGLIISLGLAFAAVLSTFSAGQRTNVLLPFLILFLFGRKISINKIALFFILALVLSAMLLPKFKYQYASSDLSTGELVARVVQGDISRGQVLTTVLEETSGIGTEVLPYPMAGYVYSVLFFVPRQIAPFKGYATATYLSSYLTGTAVSETNWGFGIGVIEEMLLNVGIWFVIPGLLLCGVGMGFLDRASHRVPALVTASRLAAIWLCGYNFPALLMTFGVMALVSVGLHHFFVRGCRCDTVVTTTVVRY